MNSRIQAIADEVSAYRHDMHKYPQTAYEETFASDLVAKKLTEWGIPFKRGYGKTGIVAIIEGEQNTSGKSVGLRADMDALDITELSGVDHASAIPGKMHACGHDGHTATLLGTAKYLNEKRNFDGTVYLVFQPAEEGAGGAKAMINDGLFNDFDCDEMFGIHNWPYKPLGWAGTRVGPLMASADYFEVTVLGTDGHAGTVPYQENAVFAAAAIQNKIIELNKEFAGSELPAIAQTTNLNAGTGALAIVPETAHFAGTVRTFGKDVRSEFRHRIKQACRNISNEFNVQVDLNYCMGTDSTINALPPTEFVKKVGKRVFGDGFDGDVSPEATAEDFSAFLQKVPGTFIWVGQGDPDNPGSPHNRSLHSPYYDFNDAVIAKGIELFTRIVEDRLKIIDVPEP